MSEWRWSIVIGLSAALLPGIATAAPAFVLHVPAGSVFGESAEVTQRQPGIPREDDVVQLYVKVGPSFTYDAVAVYYTVDGSTPQGSLGIPQPGTSVLLNFGPNQQVTFLRNEPGKSGNDDWWVATIPFFARGYGQRIQYRVSAWDTVSPVPEVFADGGATFDWTNKLAWPGAGAGSITPDMGYPPVSFWKEEAVAGNNYINVMLDQNGTVYDVYYPSAGCVNGIGTKNEGYVDGPDTFPPLLPPGDRGQMHMNQGMGGLRVDGLTYWLSNENGIGYHDVAQTYVADTNVVRTEAVLNVAPIRVEQFDFAPKGITFPTTDGGAANRGLYVKRYIITNEGGTPRELNFYYYADVALNGGDGFDATFTDTGRGAMVSSDNTQRVVNNDPEYNPTTFIAGYEKNVSLFLAIAAKALDAVGGAAGVPASDFWSDTSSDQGKGWIGFNLTLGPGAAREIDVAYVGGFDDFAGATGTYTFQMDGPIDWFLSTGAAALQATTEQYWRDWLAEGVTIDFPDDRYDDTFRRGLLGTALHLDGEGGGIIAGMHNGAYPFVWPRDAAWAAITLARAGHQAEAESIYAFLRDVAFRDVEGWGRKGFWKQKYSTDGFTIWGTPQVDETSCYPWGVRYLYSVNGDSGFLADHYDEVYEAAIASSQDSTLDSRLRYEATVDLIYSMNLWEDSFGTFNYSNASVVRGLEDAADIADTLDQAVCPGGLGTCNYHNDKALFEARANTIRGGLDARLAWNGENTDISQLGITYPFEIYPPGDPRAELIMDRINGVATDNGGNNQPLVNLGGEWADLINRYWGDGYWNNPAAPNASASPWFLTTLWYGAYFAERQDTRPGTADIDNHRLRVDRCLDRLGPIGFGAEQIAPTNSLLYPGQADFLLQTAWPNAWESMSFLVDAMMLFAGFSPDAPANTLRVEPKIPAAWPEIAFANLRLGTHRVDLRCTVSATVNRHTLTNRTGAGLDVDTWVRIPDTAQILAVAVNGVEAAHTVDAGASRVRVEHPLATGIGAQTVVSVYFGLPGDADGDGDIDAADFTSFPPCMSGPSGSRTPPCAVFDFDLDEDVDLADYAVFQGLLNP